MLIRSISISTTHSRIVKKIVSQPSSCWLKISVGATFARSGASVPAASFAAMSFAAAKKPSLMSSLKIFCQAAVVVTIVIHASGTAVTHTYLSFALLIRMPVATDSAMAASIWFAMPNRGHRMLMPPFGSTTPTYRK